MPAKIAVTVLVGLGTTQPRTQSHTQLIVACSTVSDGKLGVGLGTRLVIMRSW